MSAAGRSAKAETGHVRDPRDFYETPAWCTRAILPLLPTGGTILDPCCGRGAILDVCAEACAALLEGFELDEQLIRAANHGHSREVYVCDALALDVWHQPGLVLTNPPYRLAMEFVERALAETRAEGGTVAMLLRLNWLASSKRAAFHRAHPADVYVLPRRPSFTADGKTDAAEYGWFCWRPGGGGRWAVLEVTL